MLTEGVKVFVCQLTIVGVLDHATKEVQSSLLDGHQRPKPRTGAFENLHLTEFAREGIVCRFFLGIRLNANGACNGKGSVFDDFGRATVLLSILALFAALRLFLFRLLFGWVLFPGDFKLGPSRSLVFNIDRVEVVEEIAKLLVFVITVITFILNVLDTAEKDDSVCAWHDHGGNSRPWARP